MYSFRIYRPSYGIVSVFLFFLTVFSWGPAALAKSEDKKPSPMVKVSAARELAVRVVGLSKIVVNPRARKEVPKDLEVRLFERLIQDLNAKTYIEPQPIDGNFNSKTRSSELFKAATTAGVDGILFFEIGLEEIKGYLSGPSGRRIRSFDFRYRLGELDEKNAVSILVDRIVEGLVLSIPYRGFVTSTGGSTVGASGATINLGSNHGLKEGDVLELFEFRWPNLNAPRRRLSDVQVKKILGSGESEVALVDKRSSSTKIEPFAKISFSVVKVSEKSPTTGAPSPGLSSNDAPVVEATDSSVVNGKWWFGFGGEQDSFGPESVAIQYESRVIQVNGAPFGYLAAGNDALTLRAAFGSAKSSNESIAFFDTQGTYALYQRGGAQSAWTVAAGARVFLSQVTPNPNVTSALSTTTVISPMAELKYQYVPRGRIRLVGTTEIFWPIYSEGAAIGSLPFAFGVGLGGGLQLAISHSLGIEVFAKQRYLRRLIDGQNGIQERQTLLGAGLLLSF